MNLLGKMKSIEDERQDTRKAIKMLKEKLENLTGRAVSSEEKLEAASLSAEEESHDIAIIEKRSGDVQAYSTSWQPRFMKPTCEWSSTCYLQFEKNGMLEVTYTARTCQWNDSIAHSTVAFIIMVLKAGQKPEIEMLRGRAMSYTMSNSYDPTLSLCGYSIIFSFPSTPNSSSSIILNCGCDVSPAMNS